MVVTSYHSSLLIRECSVHQVLFVSIYHIARASITLAESCSHFCVQIYACIYVATLHMYNHPFHLLHASNIINIVSLLQILYMYTQHACKNNSIYVHTHRLHCTMHIYAYVYMTNSEQCGTMPPFRMLYVVQYSITACEYVNCSLYIILYFS